MKPNFALSLSQDGIGLRHRASDGWVPVGEADFSNTDWGDQLAALRQTATTLEHGDTRCKVVIPNDQIKFITVPFDPEADQSPDELARGTLTGATPYAVDELAFDISVGETVLQIAAVARETLHEAEDFARQHEFHPVSLVADPPPDQFRGEPFFGVASTISDALKAGESVEPDTFPISHQITSQKQEEENVSTAVPVDSESTPTGFLSRRTVPTFRTEPEESGYDFSDNADQGLAAIEEPDGASRSSSGIAPRSDMPIATPRGKTTEEADRRTVFGNRETSSLAGRRESLMRVVAVIAVVALGIAGFASGLFNTGWNTLLISLSNEAPELRFAAPPQPDAPADAALELANLPPSEQPAPQQSLSDEDAAVLDALGLPDTNLAPQVSDGAPSPENEPPELEELQANYAVFGIWPRAPDVPRPAALVELNDFYVPSIDVENPQFDAIALPALTSYKIDGTFATPASPAPAGTQFTLDENDMVVPTPQGAINPDGIPVFAGPPPLRQPDKLVRIENPGDDLERRVRLSAYRPAARPDDLIERNERAAFGGQTRAELGQYRPKIRPQSAQQSALAAASLVSLDSDGALVRETGDNDVTDLTKRAVRASLRPDARPAGFSDVVARAQRNTQPAPAATIARVAPRTVAPSIPSSASVAREATQRNAINMRKVNLIGVYGTPSSRRALVRLGNGRYRKVEVGDRIDGGRVSAIGESELRYQKSGRAVVLRMPSG